MKIPAMMIIGVLCSGSILAAEIDFSTIDPMSVQPKVIKNCMTHGWRAASPTRTQKSEAKTLIQSARKTVKSQETTLQADVQAMLAAFAASPIVSQDVEAAESQLLGDVIAVHSAVRDDIINLLNLLTPDQKTAINRSFSSCLSSSEESTSDTDEDTSVEE